MNQTPIKQERIEREEHWDVKNGLLKGLWRVDTSKAHGELWERVDDVIAAYARLHPIEVEIIVRENKIRADQALDEFARSQGKTLRSAARLPAGLLFLLQQVIPDLFENKQNFHRLIKRYKGFRTAQVV